MVSIIKSLFKVWNKELYSKIYFTTTMLKVIKKKKLELIHHLKKGILFLMCCKKCLHILIEDSSFINSWQKGENLLCDKKGCYIWGYGVDTCTRLICKFYSFVMELIKGELVRYFVLLMSIPKLVYTCSRTWCVICIFMYVQDCPVKLQENELKS